jgi:hypothetical protein
MLRPYVTEQVRTLLFEKYPFRHWPEFMTKIIHGSSECRDSNEEKGHVFDLPDALTSINLMIKILFMIK